MAKKRGFIIGGVVAVLALGGYMGYAAHETHQPDPAPSATMVQGPATAGIMAGSGGSRLGVDGRTRIGYEPSCEGAVQAMTNYLTGLWTFNPADTSKQEALARQVFTPDSTDRLTEVKWVKDQANAFKAGHATGREEEHPEWGGSYKIYSCEPGQRAKVGIFSCGRTEVHTPKQGSWGGSSCQPFLSSLSWTGSDWKLATFNNEDEQLNLNEWTPHDGTDPKSEHEFPLSKAVIAKSITDGHGKPIEGWVDYANITRK